MRVLVSVCLFLVSCDFFIAGVQFGNAALPQLTKKEIDTAAAVPLHPWNLPEFRQDGNCKWPGGCRLRIKKCTFEKGSDHIGFKEFWNDYVLKDRPVIWKGGLYRMPETLEMVKEFTLGRLLFNPVFQSTSVEIEDTASVLTREMSRLLEVEGRGNIFNRDDVGVLSSDVQDSSEVRSLYTEPWMFAKSDLFGRMNTLLRRLRVDPDWHEGYFIAGPTGGGTTLHKDFLQTSFWNACLTGGKQFIVMGPEFEDAVSPTLLSEWEELKTWEFFEMVYNSKLDEMGIRYDECHQEAGDLVWVPRGRWHITMNTELSITISHNHFLKTLPKQMKEATDCICYDRVHQEEEMEIRASMFWCFALKFVDQASFAQSCCATEEFLKHIGLQEKINPPESNPVIYKQLLDSVENLSLCTSHKCFQEFLAKKCKRHPSLQEMWTQRQCPAHVLFADKPPAFSE